MKFINTSLLLILAIKNYGVGAHDADSQNKSAMESSDKEKNSRRTMTITATSNEENRYIVKFRKQDERNRTLMGSFSEGYRLQRDDPRLIMELPDDNVEVITIESEDELQFWEDQDSVEYIEADTKIYLQGESTPWGINTVEALDVSDANVSNQKVCIIDTGYDASHPDLPTSVTGTSQISGQSWRVDGAGHGTHVAGTIAAIGGNNQGVVGVNRNGKLKLHIVKVFDNNGFWTWGSDLIKAVESCVSAGSTVVNMSLGGGGFLRAEKDAYDRVYNQNGVLIVASSGNSGTTDKSYPASYPAVISVGATDQNNQKANFSQYNNQVDLCAPGVGIKSTIPGGGYRNYDGTSMSAPHVAGVAALVWSNFPNKSAQEIREALESSAQDLGSPGRDNKYGHGLVRADLAYNFLLSNGGGGGGGNPAPVPAPTPGGGNCIDSPLGWHDSDGSKFNCQWYGEQDRCAKFGNEFPNDGFTANEACCVCGGGSNDPAPAPSPTGGGGCIDSPLGWHDSDGDKYDCEWYGEQDRCEKFGDEFPNDGFTANEACCTCGGGAIGTRSRSMPGSEVSVMSHARDQDEAFLHSSLTSPSNAMKITCGCSSCTADVLQRRVGKNGNEWVIGDQIKWAIKNYEYTETEACLLVCDDLFSDTCSECAPTYCE